MTSRELIENLKSRARKYDILVVHKEQAEDIIANLEELNTLRVEHEKNSKEDSWIKVGYREMTREEAEEFGVETDCWMYDCDLPEDNTEVLITSAYGDVDKVEFCRDVDGACWFDGYEDFDDVIAWMPVPEPYKEGAEQ